MSYLVFAVGFVLAVCGGAAIFFGYGLINVERGWSSVIAGAAALSGGVVTMALALILHSLSRLRALLKEASAFAPARAPDAADAAPAAPVVVAAMGAAERPPGAPEASPAGQASIEDIRRVVAYKDKSAGEARRAGDAAPERERREEVPPAMVAPVPAAPPRRRTPPPQLPRAVGLKDLSPLHFGAEQADDQSTIFTPGRPASEIALPPSASSAKAPPAKAPPAKAPSDAAPEAGVRPDPELVARFEASPDAAAAGARPAFAKRPEISPGRGEDKYTVIGRYESEGTTYVMFADGSIDAHSERGAFHFDSMADLKAFMDAQSGD